MYNPLIEIISCIFENLVLLQIINYFLDVKFKKSEPVFILLFTGLALQINTMTQPFWLFGALLFMNIYVVYNYTNKLLYKCCICSAVFISNVFITFFIVTLVASFSNSLFLHLQYDNFLYGCTVLISKFILVMFFFILRNLLKAPIIKPTNWKLMFIEVILFFLALLYIFYIFIEEYVGALHSILILLVQALMLLSTLYIYTKYHKSLRDQDSLKTNDILNKAYIEAIEKEQIIIGLNQQVIHDLENQIFLFKMCLDRKDFDHLYLILDGIDKIQIPTLIDTPNKALNHLLNSKSHEMTHLHIQFLTFIEDSLDFVDKNDLLLNLGMMIDILIDLIKGNENAYIRMEITTVRTGTKIVLQSNCSCADDFMEQHCNWIKKYNGVFDQNYKNGILSYIILFQISKEIA